MWWKLTILGVIEAALLGLLLLPIQTHAVKMNMPDHPPPPTAATYAVDAAAAILPVLIPIVVLGILVTPLWLAWWIIKKHRRKSDV